MKTHFQVTEYRLESGEDFRKQNPYSDWTIVGEYMLEHSLQNLGFILFTRQSLEFVKLDYEKSVVAHRNWKVYNEFSMQ